MTDGAPQQWSRSLEHVRSMEFGRRRVGFLNGRRHCALCSSAHRLFEDREERFLHFSPACMRRCSVPARLWGRVNRVMLQKRGNGSVVCEVRRSGSTRHTLHHVCCKFSRQIPRVRDWLECGHGAPLTHTLMQHIYIYSRVSIYCSISQAY